MQIMRALRAVSTARGRDPRQYSLIAFGGAGPIHAAPLARELSVQRILIPPLPGLFSAVGLLSSHLEHHDVRSCFLFGKAITNKRIAEIGNELEQTTLAQFESYGVEASRVDLTYSADVRFRGQSSEVRVRLPDLRTNSDVVEDLWRRFSTEYDRLYGHSGGTIESMEIVGIRIVGAVPRSREATLRPLEPTSDSTSNRIAYFDGQSYDTAVVERLSLTAPISGPLLIDEYDSTTVVPPSMQAFVDKNQNLWLEPCNVH